MFIYNIASDIVTLTVCRLPIQATNEHFAM